MRGANLQPTGTLRPARGTVRGQSGGDHTDAVRATIPGNWGSPLRQDVARLEGPFSRSGARSKLPGLYLTGGSVHPGPGVPMAAISGRLAAEAVLADLASS